MPERKRFFSLRPSLTQSNQKEWERGKKFENSEESKVDEEELQPSQPGQLLPLLSVSIWDGEFVKLEKRFSCFFAKQNDDFEEWLITNLVPTLWTRSSSSSTRKTGSPIPPVDHDGEWWWWWWWGWWWWCGGGGGWFASPRLVGLFGNGRYSNTIIPTHKG